MTVNVSKSGGIYIEISGDYSKLQADLKQVDSIAKAAGKEISDALSGTLTPKLAASASSNLTKYLATASRAAQGVKADLSNMDAEFRKMGQSIGVAEKDLAGFVSMQRQMLQNQSAKAFTDSLKGVQRLTGASNEEMNRLAKSLGGVGNEFTKAAKSTRELCLNMTTLYLEAAKVAGLNMIWEGFKSSFDLASRYETLGVVVQQVGRVSGISAVAVDENVSALRRMGIAGVEARKTLTQLIQAQVDVSKSPSLARIAQDAAVIGGTNSSDAFESMVHGIQSAQTEVLRTIGINVNFEQSYAKIAASLAKTTIELTEQEKVQARVNAVMEAGERITGSYEAAMSTLSKQMGSLSRIQQDLVTDFGKFLVDGANASGGTKAYTSILEGWNAIFLSLSHTMQGGSFDEITKAFMAGGLQSGRDLQEIFQSARNEFEIFEAQAKAFASMGIDVEPYVKDIAQIKYGVFDVSGEIERLESIIRIFEDEGIDASAMVSQLESLKQKFIDGASGAELLRKNIHEAMVLMRSASNTPSPNAPATLFTFKPYEPGSGKDPDIRSIDKTLTDLRAAYNKTAEGMKLAKHNILKENKELVDALVAKKHMGKEEGDKIRNALIADANTLTKGSRTASLTAERTSYQAEEAARSAADSLKNVQLRHSELVAQIDGNSLGAALARSQRDYETQFGSIAKKEAEIAQNRALWAKEGKLSPETSGYLDEQQRVLEQEKALLIKIKEANEELARRADLSRTARTNMDYAGLIGDLRAYYAEEVKLLELHMLSASEAEKRTLAEQQRIAEARASLDSDGMLQTGMANMAKDSQQRIVDFWETTIPDSLGAATDTFGNLFADIATGTKSTSDAFSDMGKTIQGIAKNIMSDLINMSIRMAMFGQNGTGGLLGGMFSSIGGSSGVTVTPLTSAKGNIFSAPALSAYSNSIVSTPTVFPFAKGIGLMGEAGAEAIMPLTRTSTGYLGVKADIGGYASTMPTNAQVVNNITITPPAGYEANETRTRNSGGGEDIRLTFSRMMAGEVNSYGSPLNSALRNQGMRSPVVRRQG